MVRFFCTKVLQFLMIEYIWDKLSIFEGCPILKKLIGALITVLVLYVIYHDITLGTLPKDNKENIAVQVSTSNVETEIPYFEKVVNPGDTVLSIVEKKSKHPLSVSISKVIADFEKLNGETKPEEIQIGNTYKFPIYKKTE
jgi:hypothetical protein